MTLFLAAIGLHLLAALAGALCCHGSRFWDLASLAMILAGCLLGLLATGLALAHPDQAALFLPWPVPGAALALKIDGLSAVFLIPALLVIATGALYATGYWPVQKGRAGSGWVRLFYPLLAGGLLMALVADNGVLFLTGWEIMALAGFFLVVTDRNEEAMRAGFIYLAATHAGTLALFGMFSLLASLDPANPLLPRAMSLAAATPQATAVFLLALLGFGLKAGLMPLHIWLPGAHAAAPSHVSALMSGVMIKVGIYGLLRTTGYFVAIPPWWGWTILTLGLLSALLGVAFAIAQHDIKRLLAYHSVENIGIILLGFGIALLGRSYDAPSLVTLGMAGALLHVINHGLFKSLLFLSAGSMIHATGTRRMSGYGGLLRPMPVTALFFLGGAVAICGLPPLNGFVSEWLVYMGLFQVSQQDAVPAMALLALPALAMTGGLALLCFAKVFGLSFLGTPRAGQTAAREAPLTMLLPMGVLLTACLWIGVAPTTFLPLLATATGAWQGTALSPALALASLAPAGNISLVALLLLLFMGAGLLYVRQDKSRQIAKGPTWGCGYQHPIPRAQYTTSSFGQMIVDFFGWALQTRASKAKRSRLFPHEATYSTHTPDGVLDLLLLPAVTLVARIASHIRRSVQNGVLGFYLLYSALTLCALLLYVTLWCGL
ncbi:MAG: proton-conducting transporter membrane subunit [Desulfobulbaceae bacterium]|nr:proton-conducting transporter membrane subunit [Desulfobulbaceae bacterium]